MNIGFLGTGRIAAPMVEALARADNAIFVSERSRRVSQDLEARFENVSVRDNQGVLDESEAVVICLLAATGRDELPRLSFRPDHKVVSVMADIGLDEIARLIGETAELCVTIPYPFIKTGGCPLVVYPASPVLERMFGTDNFVIPLENERAVGPHFAATAVTSTLLKELITVRDWLGSHADGPVAAEKYMALLVSGYLNAIEKDGANRLDEAIDDLATEGGLNAQLLRHMEGAGTMERLKTGLDDLLHR